MSIIPPLDEVVSVPYDESIHSKHLLTHWQYPDERCESGWSRGYAITHNDWLKLELSAFIKNGRNAIVVKNRRGQLALADLAKEIK